MLGDERLRPPRGRRGGRAVETRGLWASPGRPGQGLGADVASGARSSAPWVPTPGLTVGGHGASPEEPFVASLLLRGDRVGQGRAPGGRDSGAPTSQWASGSVFGLKS